MKEWQTNPPTEDRLVLRELIFIAFSPSSGSGCVEAECAVGGWATDIRPDGTKVFPNSSKTKVRRPVARTLLRDEFSFNHFVADLVKDFKL